MNDFNETVIIGRATEDIKTAVYGDKIKYMFIVAVNYYSNKKKQKYCEFIPVCFWKDQSFKELDQLEKGDSIIVNGRVSIHSYEKNNEKKWVTEVIGKYVRVFKQNKETKDMADLLQLIKSNKKLLDEITASSDIMFSDDLTAELLSEDGAVE